MKFNHIFGMICFIIGIFIINTTTVPALILAGLAVVLNRKEIITLIKELD